MMVISAQLIIVVKKVYARSILEFVLIACIVLSMKVVTQKLGVRTTPDSAMTPLPVNQLDFVTKQKINVTILKLNVTMETHVPTMITATPTLVNVHFLQ